MRVPLKDLPYGELQGVRCLTIPQAGLVEYLQSSDLASHTCNVEALLFAELNAY